MVDTGSIKWRYVSNRDQQKSGSGSAEFGDRLTDALGAPTRREPGEAGALLWDRHRVWIRLNVGWRDIRLHLVSEEWQATGDGAAKHDAGHW
ncbi:DUF6301 family protein [Nocardia sp. FBN12]|uniref:DUF6301 family protein n=1 Tax=Nocardia sp. FBN12 TaxID=3419766 RepID=UPI003D0455BB